MTEDDLSSRLKFGGRHDRGQFVYPWRLALLGVVLIVAYLAVNGGVPR